jgi:hypothetical protein
LNPSWTRHHPAMTLWQSCNHEHLCTITERVLHFWCKRGH